MGSLDSVQIQSREKVQSLEQHNTYFIINNIQQRTLQQRCSKPLNISSDDLNTDVEDNDDQQKINFINNFTVQGFFLHTEDQYQNLECPKNSNQLQKCLSLTSQDSSSNNSQTLDLKSDDSVFNKQDDFFAQGSYQDQTKQVLSFFDDIKNDDDQQINIQNSCIEKSQQVVNKSKFYESQKQNFCQQMNEQVDNPQINFFNMDFYEIYNKYLVQLLLKSESNQLISEQQYFYSELVIKISRKVGNSDLSVQPEIQGLLHFVFQSLKNQDNLYKIKLQNNDDYPNFIKSLQNCYNQ
ncbi:hypothetical protein TTHERM_00745810 (macronuclear) [Tetrahymena thermophila SB210]|uniref:Uncharacterized protein n=1 Tax=Tetrahymena thermophila (strain SB210) TaxID=312017 RepID=Q239U9_TETTS|nr:hypothetical protein TTHERM_00745810 [Tetrahymena thermophila SB210]EAR93309.2 hypothetical protein TTHERM_00745810 [Tetrahymena thermophila SB210]|eukprot:XP_001013554.2 hypothetical protein TTHERM_00745810 [Tetrahymena thermophila SB210]